jgi:hypothetical protein
VRLNFIAEQAFVCLQVLLYGVGALVVVVVPLLAFASQSKIRCSIRVARLYLYPNVVLHL